MQPPLDAPLFHKRILGGPSPAACFRFIPAPGYLSWDAGGDVGLALFLIITAAQTGLPR